MQNRPKVISFFSGCGGLDSGFDAVGFEIPVAVEFADYACETYRNNFPNTVVMGPPIHSGDISKMSGKEILKFAGLSRQDVDIVIGGPPCQPFSVAAAQRFLRTDNKFKRKGFADKKRGTLLLDFIKIILELKPKVFLIENVPGIVTIDGGKQVSIIRKMVERFGYHLNGPFIVNVADYGIPQNRRRAIIIGSRANKDLEFPAPTHGRGSLFGSQKHVAVAQSLINIDASALNHETRNHGSATLARYKKLKFGEREPLGRVDRLDPIKPSKTIIAGGSNGGGRSHLHPFAARTLTVRESARLQTFNDEFAFTGSIARQFTQVGNAVPPLFAEILARYIADKEFGIKITGPFKNGGGLACHLSPLQSSSLLHEQAEKESNPLYHDVRRKPSALSYQNEKFALSY